MGIIQQKLKENKSKMRREKLLSASELNLSDFIAHAECSNEISCIKNAAFPEWNNKINGMTTSRGKIANWNNFSFKSWQELIAVLKRFQQVKNYIGWFFLDREGPYFKVSLNAFLSNVPNISDYGSQTEHYDYGWVGEVDNVGIIIEKNNGMSTDRKFNISIWGI